MARPADDRVGRRQGRLGQPAHLAGAMGIAETQVEMIEVDVGGGFGSRGEFYPEDFLIPFAARHVGRPVVG